MSSADVALRQLIDEYRTRCLWFLREDYYPATPEERERVFAAIERYGDLAAFRRVTEIREWLSLHSSDASAVS
jgi:hypothetical protein